MSVIQDGAEHAHRRRAGQGSDVVTWKRDAAFTADQGEHEAAAVCWKMCLELCFLVLFYKLWTSYGPI